LQAIADPLNQYRLPESMPLVGGMSAADFTGLTGAQGVLQDFSRGNLQSGDMRMFDLLGLGAGAVPVAKTALKGGGLLGKEALRQMNEGTGLLGKTTIDPRMYVTSKTTDNVTSEVLDTLNPTGVGSRSGLYAEYNPQIRATQPLSENIVPIYKTMGGSPDDLITIYRGAPKNQKKIVAGDFITDMPELAKSYIGDDGKILSMKVRLGDVLDDIREPLGNEYLYRPNADKYKYK
jgi:hypothetical protein